MHRGRRIKFQQVSNTEVTEHAELSAETTQINGIILRDSPLALRVFPDDNFSSYLTSSCIRLHIFPLAVGIRLGGTPQTE